MCYYQYKWKEKRYVIYWQKTPAKNGFIKVGGSGCPCMYDVEIRKKCEWGYRYNKFDRPSPKVYSFRFDEESTAQPHTILGIERGVQYTLQFFLSTLIFRLLSRQQFFLAMSGMVNCLYN